MNKWHCFLSGLALLALSACVSKPQSLLDTTDRPLSIRMAESEMARHESATSIDGNLHPKWNYTPGLEMLAFVDLANYTGDARYYEYAKGYADSLINDNGKIATYSLTKYNIDHVCPGCFLFDLYGKTQETRYKTAMDTLFSQLKGQPRTHDGGFWHKAVYPWQMWLDGLYMGEPFYARYVSEFVPDEDKAAYYEDIIHQFVTVGEHTYDPETGLYRHAWDESREMFWCDKTTGQSEHCWGRGLGWYVMGMVDVLDYLPESSDRQAIVNLLNGIYEVLPSFADRKTGMWYQVLDCPGREGNYLESTGSIMFIYGLLKGVKTGVFSEKYLFLANEWYRKFVNTFVRENADGTLSITQCCAGAGLGGDGHRSGTFEYYIHETEVRDDDCKATAPFIWASMYYEQLNSK